MKESRGRVSIRDTTSVCSEHLYTKHVGLGLKIDTIELCGSDEWEIYLQEE